MWRIVGFVLVAVAARCWGQPLATDSPLAAEGQRLFAVLEDGRTIVSRPTDATSGWERVRTDVPIGRVAGLAATNGRLFVADAERAAVLAIPLAEGRPSVLINPGDIKRPGSLVAADRDPDDGVEVLYLADGGSGRIYRLWVDHDNAKYAPLYVAPPIGERAMLASWRDALVISDPEQDLLLRISDAPYGAWLSEKLQAPPDDRSGERRSSSAPRTTYRGTKTSDDEYPRIDRPGAVATREGIVYAVSESSHEIYSTPRYARRPVRSGFSTPAVHSPSRILVTEESMFVLDADTKDVVRWPRPVPTEFTFEVDAPSTCMARFYRYLRDRAALPTRVVPLDQSLERTLRKQEVLRSPWVEALDELMCGLNPTICTGGRPNQKIASGQEIHIPDLLVEGKLVNRRITLDGKTSVRAYVDRSITSDEFDYAKKAEYLSHFNRAAAARAQLERGDLLDARAGDFILPKELVRYVAAVPEADVRDGVLGDALQELKRRCPGAEINPLETRHAVKSQDADATWQAVHAAYQHVTDDVLHYDREFAKALMNNPNSATPFVGIVERDIDATHPDFFDQAGTSGFLREPAPTPAGQCCMRRAEAEADHGTAVAYLIGGRRRHAEDGRTAGLAPMARLVELEDELSSLPGRFGESEYHDDVFVANMSLRTPPSTRDDAILSLLNDNPQTLFVVAAGNNKKTEVTKELCKAVDVYPACEYARPNVLVVGATSADGATMLAPSDSEEGSHWSPTAVHVVAPGVGFEAPGSADAYVPVRGTSFAAPLVTATAALLVAQGIVEPWAIKQRIIATADTIDSLRGYVLGGLLNVKRAVTDPHEAVLIDDHDKRSVVKVITSGEFRMRFGNKPSRGIPFKDILRLQNVAGSPEWRLVYRPTDYEIAVVDGVRADKPWTFSYVDDKGRGSKHTDQLDRFSEYVAAAQQ